MIPEAVDLYEMLFILQSVKEFSNYRLIVYTDESGHIEDNHKEPFITFNDLAEGVKLLLDNIPERYEVLFKPLLKRRGLNNV